MPGGFGDATDLAKERDYKDKARSALNIAVPLDRALEADAGDALGCRKGLATNLLSRFEAARLSEVIAFRDGPMFVRAAASFAFGRNSLTVIRSWTRSDSLLAM